MGYKRITPCILIEKGKAVRWFDDRTVVSDNVVELAKHYCEWGADELIVFDLSDTDEEHEEAVQLMRKINRVISIPMVAGGNIRRQEDVKNYLYIGAKRAILNFSKTISQEMLEEVSKRFGKERIGVSLNDFDGLFKKQHQIAKYSSEVIFMHRLDLNSVLSITDIPCVVMTDTMEQSEILKILKSESVKGVSGLFVSQQNMDFNEFKLLCAEEGIRMTSFESLVHFSEFQTDEQGMITVVVQDYKTNEVLMVGKMDEEAFNHTIKSGRMTYYDPVHKEHKVKGEHSGHYQYLKSFMMDCDRDTLLAKVEQIGVACRTGNHSCFYQQIVGTEYDARNPLQVFENIYDLIAERKENPKEGSYINYLFDKGLDKILKKIGEEATEMVIAAKNPSIEEIKYEMADFLFHAMILMVEKGVTWEDVTRELADR